jgi:hypothetical protein
MADINCPECGRPMATTAHQQMESSHCNGTGSGSCLHTQLATAEAKLVEAERENAAWRGLFEHNATRGGEFCLQRCSDGTWYADCGSDDAEAATPQAAAIDLATKLGLIDKEGG